MTWYKEGFAAAAAAAADYKKDKVSPESLTKAQEFAENLARAKAKAKDGDGSDAPVEKNGGYAAKRAAELAADKAKAKE